MELTRTLNVITMACLLFLTGCFGVTNDTITPEADGQTSTTVDNSTNNAPFISTASLLNNPTFHPYTTERDVSYSPTTGDEILNGFSVHLHHAVVDVDGDAMTMGWDINLDGNIDVASTVNSGTSNVTIDISHWTDISSLIDDEGVYQVMVAFIAIDEHGAGSAEFVEVWAGNDRDESSNDLDLYVMDAEDAAGSPTDANNDTLVRVTMTQGSDINWAAISVKISVNNGAPITCNNPGSEGATLGCDLVEFGDTSDQFWSVTDGVTISESGQNLCDTSTPCSIKVTVGNTQEGKTLDESSTIAS